MIYELAHTIKDKLHFLWSCIEYGNSIAFSIRYGKKLVDIDNVVNEGILYPYSMRRIVESDLPQLADFFRRQPVDSFRFFNPHKFDMKSLCFLLHNHSFLAFVLLKKSGGADDIVGYAFMRSFANGSAYRGYIVDVGQRGKGLAKTMGYGLNRVGDTLGLKMYKSISPCNTASMKVTQAVCDIEMLRTLENGDYLIRCMSKKPGIVDENVIGGVMKTSSKL